MALSSAASFLGHRLSLQSQLCALRSSGDATLFCAKRCTNAGVMLQALRRHQVVRAPWADYWDCSENEVKDTMGFSTMSQDKAMYLASRYAAHKTEEA